MKFVPRGVVSRVEPLPIHLHEKAPDSPPHEPLIGIVELADWLGVSAHTVEKWASAGPASKKIPRLIRLNGVTRFDPAAVVPGSTARRSRNELDVGRVRRVWPPARWQRDPGIRSSPTAFFVRCRVDGKARRRTFKTRAHAKTFRDLLISAKVRGWHLPAPSLEVKKRGRCAH